MGRQFGNYEILRKVAAGGMAEVFLAKHQGLGGFERLVCIKRILPHLSEQEDFIKMFQDEARIVANLIHPNIAQIYDVGQLDGTYYIAMEYVRGEDLRRVYNGEVARGRAMPLEPAAHIAMGAASGLDFAHRQTSIDGRPLGIVHRDVSPQNILVNYDGHVKLIDFGVAKAEGKLNETRSGVLKGKYSYMSPEQASGDPIDGRSDVFALGITLYEVTTGVRLFKRESEIETLHAVIEGNVTSPGELIPGYDDEMQEIVMRALAHDPDDRYPTAGDMERSLEGFLVKRNHPTSAASLASYMQDLFAEKLADELLFGGQPWEESLTPSRHDPSTRQIDTNSADNSASAKTEVSNPSFEDTAIEVSGPESAFTPVGAVWGVPDDWATSAESVSKTTTHDPRVVPELVPRPSQPATQRPSSPVQPSTVGVPWQSRWLGPVAIATLIIGLSIAVALIISSRRRNPSELPRSGTLAVDSEPRGARVVFVGPGADELNQLYEGYRTPFAIVEGVPVQHGMKMQIIKDGFDFVETDLPPLEVGVVPQPIFVELTGSGEKAEGTLVVLSTPPGAEVWLDGNRVNSRTPLNNLRVRGGEMHKIEVRLAGYIPKWETVYVEAGSRRFIEATLFQESTGADPNPENPIPAIAPTEDAIAPSSLPDAGPTNPPDPPRQPTGGKSYLTVTSPHKLKVTVDRKNVGETPIRKLAVDSGVRQLRLYDEKEGFTLRRKVRLVAGRTETVDIRPGKGKLSVNATPWAWVRIGKSKPAETPMRIDLFEGEYAVLFECPDGSRKRENTRVTPGQTTSLSVSCRK
ncbi:MAG: hypothetical protein A2341_23620 [Deltaproteobacteria bacterium RIFOXYB12_FULL_58_9]|nr:MAG: hypothetical protein A2341_23620 [Deltaproteobacteria bacterium RIFOXYB12_FULL_58_9]